VSSQNLRIHTVVYDPPPVVTAASANGRYLVDQYGTGIIPQFDTLWAMVQQAGNTALNGGSATWQQDVDFWISKPGRTGLERTKVQPARQHRLRHAQR